MTELVDALLALQSFEGLIDSLQIPASYASQLARLREPIPVSVLLHYSLRRKKNELSIAAASSSGVLGHCHSSLPATLAQQMTPSGALFSCPRCDGFLYTELAAEIRTPALPAKAKLIRQTAPPTVAATT